MFCLYTSTMLYKCLSLFIKNNKNVSFDKMALHFLSIVTNVLLDRQEFRSTFGMISNTCFLIEQEKISPVEKSKRQMYPCMDSYRYFCTEGLLLFFVFYLFSLATWHGFPYAITLLGIFLVTTLPAPITTLSPIVTPGIIITPPPIHTSLPIKTGAVCVLQNSKEPSSLGLPNLSIAFVG